MGGRVIEKKRERRKTRARWRGVGGRGRRSHLKIHRTREALVLEENFAKIPGIAVGQLNPSLMKPPSIN